MNIWLLLVFALLFFFASGTLAALLSRLFTRKSSSDAREIEIRGLLPGHDCGLCGETSCRDFAATLAQGRGDLGRCIPGGAELETRLRRLFADRPAQIALVRCGGTKADSPDIFHYSGISDCAVAASIYDGPRACRDACLGYGSCIASCPVGAIGIVEGLAVVDPDRCTGCGACEKVCPTGVISLVPAQDPLFVACNSKSPAAKRSAICTAACTGCRVCERPDGAPSFAIQGDIAVRSSWNIADAGAFMRSCPTGVIREPRKAATKGRAS